MFTPTEAAVVAAVYSLFVAVFVYRELKPRQLYAVLVTAAKTTSVVMFLVAAALVSSWLLTVAELPAKIIALLQPFMANQMLLVLAIMVVVLIVGTAHGHDAHHPDPHAGADAGRQGGRHRPGLFRRAVHHQQLDRPDHAAGRRGAERGRAGCRA